jgi:hypothetical protein
MDEPQLHGLKLKFIYNLHEYPPLAVIKFISSSDENGSLVVITFLSFLS